VVADPLGFGALFVGVGPVEDLLFDEFAGGQGAKGGAGEVEVVVGGDGEDLFVVVVQGFALGGAAFLFVFAREEVFGVVALPKGIDAHRRTKRAA
jgi:hypothetical protein